jgi:hypothetical protein
MEKEAERIDLSFAAYVRRILKQHRQQEEDTRHAEEAKPPDGLAEADPPLTDAGPEAERPGP